MNFCGWAFSEFAGEACALQEVAEIGEGDVRVGASGEDFGEDFPGFAHQFWVQILRADFMRRRACLSAQGWGA